jgi:hypothetical protein
LASTHLHRLWFPTIGDEIYYFQPVRYKILLASTISYEKQNISIQKSEIKDQSQITTYAKKASISGGLLYLKSWQKVISS